MSRRRAPAPPAPTARPADSVLQAARSAPAALALAARIILSPSPQALHVRRDRADGGRRARVMQACLRSRICSPPPRLAPAPAALQPAVRADRRRRGRNGEPRRRAARPSATRRRSPPRGDGQKLACAAPGADPGGKTLKALSEAAAPTRSTWAGGGDGGRAAVIRGSWRARPRSELDPAARSRTFQHGVRQIPDGVLRRQATICSPELL